MGIEGVYSGCTAHPKEQLSRQRAKFFISALHTKRCPFRKRASGNEYCAQAVMRSEASAKLARVSFLFYSDFPVWWIGRSSRVNPKLVFSRVLICHDTAVPRTTTTLPILEENRIKILTRHACFYQTNWNLIYPPICCLLCFPKKILVGKIFHIYIVRIMHSKSS